MPEIFDGGAHGIYVEQSVDERPNSPVWLRYGLGLAYQRITTDVTLGDLDCFSDVDASGGNRIITLPTSQGATIPRLFIVTKSDSSLNTVTIQRGGTDTINGGTSFVLTTQYSAAICMYRDYGLGTGKWEVIPIGSYWPDVKRQSATRGTAVALADFTLDLTATGWGTGATAAVTANSNDMRGQLSITVGTTPAANPTAKLTYKDGAFTSPPFVCLTKAGNLSTFPWGISSMNTTDFTAIRNGTPTAAQVERFIWGLHP